MKTLTIDNETYFLEHLVKLKINHSIVSERYKYKPIYKFLGIKLNNEYIYGPYYKYTLKEFIEEYNYKYSFNYNTKEIKSRPNLEMIFNGGIVKKLFFKTIEEVEEFADNLKKW